MSRVARIACLAIVAMLLITSLSTIKVASQTVSFEGDYPWLIAGAYADYGSLVTQQPPFFVTSSGQLLMLAPGKHGTPVLNYGFGLGSASLNWSVVERLGNNVKLNIEFSTVGCQDNQTAYNIMNQTAAPCISYSFRTSLEIDVNLTNNDGYANGTDVGQVNFWSLPLLQNGTIQSGSVFINGERFDSLANVTSPMQSSDFILPPGMQSINVSGESFSKSFLVYKLTPITFGIRLSQYYIGWLNGSIQAIGSNPILASTFGPSGLYDYYNGLAYEFSIPQFPINQTICLYNYDRPTNCKLAFVSTTLGRFFGSGGGTMLLRSTNIQLQPTQRESSPEGIFSSWTLLIISPIVAISAVGMYFLKRRRPHFRTRIRN
jgi:hypothetical protein